MRSRVIVFSLLVACGGSTVEAPPLTVPTQPDKPDEAEGFTIDPAAPYARLFEDGATWTLPATTWIGAGKAPVVTCAVSAVQKFPAARVAQLVCTADRDLGPLGSALPGYGVVATDDGLWITSNAGVIEPPPTTADELTTLLATQPIRLAVKPAPIHDSRDVDQPGTRPIRVHTTIDAAALGDAWCLTDENTAGTETVTSVVCLRAKVGVVGALAGYRSHGIVLEALALGEGPLPAPSSPYEIELATPATEVTVIAPGKGKRERLTLVAKVGAEQQVEYVIDSKTRAQTVPAAGAKDVAKPVEQAQPTLTLRGVVRVESVDADGIQLRFTLADSVPPLPPLDGFVYLAAVRPDGQVARTAIHVEHPTPATPPLVAQIAQSMTTFTVLPVTPIGVGARWSSRNSGQVLDREVEITTTSRLTERRGGRAVIVSESSIVPFEQPVPRGSAKVDARGHASMQTVDGALVPLRTYDFTLSVAVTPTDATAARETRELQMRTRVLPK